jgi:hypothetical protein
MKRQRNASFARSLSVPRLDNQGPLNAAPMTERAVTVRERAANIAKNIDIMAEEIAKRSIPSSDDSFREWSSQRLHERIKTHACSIILDYLLGESQTLAA